MAIPMSKGSDALLTRSARVALYLTLALVAIAGVYYGALYLVAR